MYEIKQEPKRQVAESNFRGHPTKTTDKSFLEYEQADEDE
jgi:hypothetical protein